MRALARTSYRALVALHPQAFRAEFGQEMLWIFDEEMQSDSHGRAPVPLFTRLLLDALRSVLIQHALRNQKPEMVGLHFQTVPSRFVSRVSEGGFLVVSCLFNLVIIVAVLAALVTSR